MGHERAQFGTNTNLVKKRVRWYNRESSAETIYEGQPVCYMYDTTTNILGYDKGAGGLPECQTTPTTTAEGYQNEGKFLLVEKPYSDNLQWFAGVVAPGSWVGQSVAATSYEWIEIFVPNGAIVPVRAGVECTVGRTVLAILSDAQYLGHPLSATQGRAVAIAEETNATLDTTNGLVLAKLDPNLFMYQDNTGDTLYFGVGGTAASASQCVNYINLETAHTGGYGSGMVHKVTSSGTIASTGGAASIISYLKISGSITATTSYTRATLSQLDLTGGTLNGSNIHITALMAQINGNPTITAVSKMACIMLDQSISGSGPTAGDLSFVRMANNNSQNANVKYVFDIYGGYGVENLYNFDGCENTGEDTSYMIFAGGTGSGALSTGGTWKKIRVVIDSSDYYFVALPDPTSA